MNAEIEIFFDNDTALEIEVLLDETFHSTGSFQSKIPAEHDFFVIKRKIKVWWKEVGGEEQELTENGIQYFETVFKDKPSGNYLYHQLSVDGVKLIPELFNLTRKRALDLTNLIFAKYLNYQDNLKKNNAETSFTSGNNLSKDEEDIIEYIAGYILCKLTKKNLGEAERRVLNDLIDQEHSFSDGSLIKTLNISKYGSLTKPSIEVLHLLCYVERQFRIFFSAEESFMKVFHSLDVTIIKEFFYNYIFDNSFLNVIDKLCKSFIKIRCYQKARKLNEHLQHDQNISFRKKLKSG